MIRTMLHCPGCGKKQMYQDDHHDEYMKCECMRCGTRFAVEVLSIEEDEEV